MVACIVILKNEVTKNLLSKTWSITEKEIMLILSKKFTCRALSAS